MRTGKIEQLATPEQVFEEPASEYVAGFIGMANRLVFERLEGAWTVDERPVTGDVDAIATSSPRIIARTRAEDVRLAPVDEDVIPPGSLAFPANVVDSEFGGRHLDVVVTVGSTRAQSRIPAGERGSWGRTLEAGQRVTAYINPRDVAFYDESGSLVSSVGRVAVGT
jgi:iron(III) transport system ATP-binding protein